MVALQTGVCVCLHVKLENPQLFESIPGLTTLFVYLFLVEFKEIVFLRKKSAPVFIRICSRGQFFTYLLINRK